MRNIFILALVFLSSCEPSYAIMYRVDLKGVEEKKIESIKIMLIEKSKFVKEFKMNYGVRYNLTNSCMAFVEKNNEMLFAFQCIGNNTKNVQMNILTDVLVSQLKKNDIKFKIDEEIKSGNIFSNK